MSAGPLLAAAAEVLPFRELQALAVAFFAPALVFGLLERAFPASPAQRVLRPQLGTDFLFFLGQLVLWRGAALFVLALLYRHLRDVLPPGFTGWVGAQPLWLQLAATVVLSDLFIYWGHRLQHHSALLWRFHAVHHSSEHLDWLAAYREHPLDGLYTQIVGNLPVLLLGLRFEPLLALYTLRGAWAIFIHANVRIPLGPLRVLLGSPELHHWHHCRERFHGNYANLSPLMDVLFGTYRFPPHEPDTIGLSEPHPRGYFRQLAWPLWRWRGGRGPHVAG